jgi:glycosyltransferase involved in cell wall biosynthesis
MRVLVVTHSKNIWGAERQLFELRTRLLGEGIYITLACESGSDLSEAWAATGSQTVHYEPAGALGLRDADGNRSGFVSIMSQVRMTAADAWRIVGLIRTTGADVVESYTLNANVEVVLAGHLTRTPSVLDVHDIVVPGFGRRVLGFSAVAATATIANSRATASTMSRGRIDIVYPGVDVSRFCPGSSDPDVRAQLAARPDRPIVGILGRIDPEKGIDVVARAVARLPPPLDGTQLAIVGASLMGGQDYDRELRAEVTRLLGERARFVEPTNDVPGVMRSLDVLVNASRAEPFGLTVLEAQACGVPVVASAAGGIPEFVVSGVNGYLFQPGDETALARALETVLADEASRRRIAQEGVATAQDKSMDRQAAQVADLYRSACARKSLLSRPRG